MPHCTSLAGHQSVKNESAGNNRDQMGALQLGFAHTAPLHWLFSAQNRNKHLIKHQLCKGGCKNRALTSPPSCSWLPTSLVNDGWSPRDQPTRAWLSDPAVSQTEPVHSPAPALANAQVSKAFPPRLACSLCYLGTSTTTQPRQLVVRVVSGANSTPNLPDSSLQVV